MRQYHYTYYSYEEWGRGYIGHRSCYCLPEEDVLYFGSFSDKTFCPTKKIILEAFDSVTQAIKAEIVLHDFYEVDVNPHFANKVKQTSTRFACRGNWKGKHHSKETKEKLGRINRGRKMSRTSIEKMKEDKMTRKWWTNGVEQKFVKDCPGPGWRRGMLEGTTKGGEWWNNGKEQIYIKPPKSIPLGAEWERGKLNKKPPRKLRKKLFDESFRSIRLPANFIVKAEEAKKRFDLARIGDGVVLVWKNENEEGRKLLLRGPGEKSIFLPKDTLCEIDTLKTLLRFDK
jgi:hypothetical protein